VTVHDEGRALVQQILDRKGVKLCGICKVAKPFEAFQVAYTSKKGKVSYRHDCKECQNKRRRDWRHSNPTGAAQIAEYDATQRYQAEQQEATAPHARNFQEVWTVEDEQFIRDHPVMTIKQLALTLKRTYTAVARRKTVLRKRGKL
jgi:hypothetical protein